MQQGKQTIVINNFGGRLTRILNGDLNSGFAKFDTSFGYDPFTKPMNLTWLGKPSVIGGTTDVVMGGVTRPSSGYLAQTVVAVTTTGKLYGILVNNIVANEANADSVTTVRSVLGNYSFGAGMSFYGISERLYLGGESTIVKTASVTGIGSYTLDGSSDVVAASSLVGFSRPLREFAGKLIFGNGPSIGAIDNTGTIVSSVFTVNAVLGNQYSELNPPLPSDQYVRDLDVTPDRNYLIVSASTIPPDPVFSATSPVDRLATQPGEGAIFGWNGVDKGVTTALTIPSGQATALQTYLQYNMLFLNDAFGSAVSDGVKKILTLPGNKSPRPNATAVNGNFLTWACPESVDGDTKRVASLYYFGSLDEENPTGLYRLLRHETTLVDGFVYEVPYNAVVSNNYETTNTSVTGMITTGYGKHYLSTYNVSSLVSLPTHIGANSLLRFLVTPATGDVPQQGVYETQTQLFQKRTHIEQIRVYTESTVAGNSFQLDIIGVDGGPIENGTFTYSFVAGSDITKLEGSLQRINFNPKADAGYGFGIRLTNTGTTNMVIKKVEVDWSEEGK